MPLSRILPEFGAHHPESAVKITDVSLEDQKLASFEAGYKAGWDDSSAANAASGKQVSADLSQNVGDLAITYDEAYGAIFSDLRPLLLRIVDALLPMMARETLAPRVAELVEQGMTSQSGRALKLHAAEDECALLRPMVERIDDGSLQIELQADETLASGQVRLAFEEGHEEELDTTELVDGIQNAIRGFFQNHNADVSLPDPLEINVLKETA